MAANNQYAQNLVFNGLGTISVKVPNADLYSIRIKSSIPTLVNGGGVSQLLIVMNKNGSPVYTGVAGASGAEKTQISCAAGDTLAVVFSSSAPADQPLNVIKSVISITQGE